MDKYKRLPLWAQRELNVLKQNVGIARRELNDLYGRNPTNVYINDYPDKNPLPNNAKIFFVFGERYGEKIEAYIVDNHLEIYGDDIQILPRANNHVCIKLGRLK